MTQVLFTRASTTDTGITVTLNRLVEADLLSSATAVTFMRGDVVNLYLTDRYGNKSRVSFMVNRVGASGAKTLRSITSIATLKGQPRVGNPTKYKVSKK
jgi:hypothetical protein